MESSRRNFSGKLENFTRDGINAKIISLGVKILTEQEFLEMLSA